MLALRRTAGLTATGALVVAAAAAAGATTADRVDWALLMAAVAGCGLVLLALTIEPAWTFSAAIVLSVLSGNAERIGLPIGPDRVAIAVGLGVLAVRVFSEGGRAPRVTFAHWTIAVAAAWAVISAVWAGTLSPDRGLFDLLDRFGLVPFLLFALAPSIFPTERERMILVGALVVLGLYLGLTAIFEALDLDALIVPSYIADPSAGLHYGRARGPFVEAVADGLALLACGVAATLAFTRWRSTEARAFALGVAALDLVGVVLTLTRAVWLAAAVVPLVVLISSARLRRFALPAVLAGVLVVGAAFAAVPDLSQKAGERSRSERPIWDRVNTDEAALRMLQERPIAGFGWDRFEEASAPYMRQGADFPITGVGIPVHNVPLSHAVELGLVGAALWALAFTAAVLAPALRRASPALEPFRLALLALALSWLVVGMFGPLGYAFPTLLLWTWAGIVHGAERRG